MSSTCSGGGLVVSSNIIIPRSTSGFNSLSIIAGAETLVDLVEELEVGGLLLGLLGRGGLNSCGATW